MSCFYRDRPTTISTAVSALRNRKQGGKNRPGIKAGQVSWVKQNVLRVQGMWIFRNTQETTLDITPTGISLARSLPVLFHATETRREGLLYSLHRSQSTRSIDLCPLCPNTSQMHTHDPPDPVPPYAGTVQFLRKLDTLAHQETSGRAEREEAGV